MNQGKPSFATPALVGGAFLGITSALPLIGALNCACCLLVLVGGVIASFMYSREYPWLTYGDGATVGALAGLFGGVIWTAVSVPLEWLKMRIGLGLADVSALEGVLDRSDIPPEFREILLNLVSDGGMGMAMIFFSFALNLVLGLIFATIGGVIGTAIFRKEPPVTPPDTGQWMPPPGPMPPVNPPPTGPSSPPPTV